jgi:uncharacterized protein
MPELGQIAALTARRSELEIRSREIRVAVDDLGAEQAKADADVETVKARRARDRDRMDQGLITNPKDLERMSHELVSLERRISSLEDDELAIMERLEEAQSSQSAAVSALSDVERQLATLAASRDQKVAAIEEELHELAVDRRPRVADLPTDLVALYDRIRAGKDGVGAAALVGRECGGCRLTLDAAELAQISAAPSNQVVRCEECQRILVRATE